MEKETIKRLKAYHNEFKGDTFELCAVCEGECERHAISCLAPGELELLASFLKISPEEFREKYTDGIATTRGEVEVLRLCTRCPFISDTYRCTVKKFKPVMCDIYPVYAEVKENGKLRFALDPKCPLSHYAPSAEVFRKKCIPALKRLRIPVEIYAAVEEFDCESYDFDKLDAQRQGAARKLYTLSETRQGIVDRSPGKIAKFWAGKASCASGDDEALVLLIETLRKAEAEPAKWAGAAAKARKLKDRFTTSDDAEYICALYHLAKGKAAPARWDIHRAVGAAALARVPAANRRTALHKWLKERLSIR